VQIESERLKAQKGEEMNSDEWDRHLADLNEDNRSLREQLATVTGERNDNHYRAEEIIKARENHMARLHTEVNDSLAIISLQKDEITTLQAANKIAVEAVNIIEAYECECCGNNEIAKEALERMKAI